MAETINGTKAVVWGIPGGLGLAGTGVCTTFEPQSIQFSAEADEATIRNSRGQEITDIFYNQRLTLTIEVIPTAGTVANAKTANIIPAPGAIVTISDSATPDDDAELAEYHSGKYICVRASKSKSNTDVTRITMELKQYVENDVAVAVS